MQAAKESDNQTALNNKTEKWEWEVRKAWIKNENGRNVWDWKNGLAKSNESRRSDHQTIGKNQQTNRDEVKPHDVRAQKILAEVPIEAKMISIELEEGPDTIDNHDLNESVESNCLVVDETNICNENIYTLGLNGLTPDKKERELDSAISIIDSTTTSLRKFIQRAETMKPTTMTPQNLEFSF